MLVLGICFCLTKALHLGTEGIKHHWGTNSLDLTATMKMMACILRPSGSDYVYAPTASIQLPLADILRSST
ncbi:hypothetical protein BDW59DRAFT_153399 [Aspergillus cavernicola]|uniref:Uncharacterized protein n=1 Tax=Aspergillus cavernicola TaxID=176166 RepID=A0ABR4HL89_9EURO